MNKLLKKILIHYLNQIIILQVFLQLAKPLVEVVVALLKILEVIGQIKMNNLLNRLELLELLKLNK
jgi:hypothetical protein